MMKASWLPRTAAFTLMVGCGGGSAEQKQHVARADTLFQQQKFAEAAAESRAAVKAEPNNVDANRVLGLSHLETGQLVQAYHYLLKAGGSGQDAVPIRIGLAAIYLIDGNVDQAREQALWVLDADSTNTDARLVMSTTALTAPELTESTNNLAKAAAKTDESRALVAGLGAARRGDSAAARKAFDKLTASPAGSAVERARLARQLVLAGQRSAAKRLLRNGAGSGPEAAPVTRLLAELALVDGEASEAQTLIAGLLQRDSSDVDALVQRGRLRAVTGDLSGAIADLQRAVRLRGDLAPVHYALSSTALQELPTKAPMVRDSVVRAVRVELSTAMRLAPNYPEAMFGWAELAVRTGDSRGAISDLERFVRNNPRSIKGHRLLGAALTAAGRAAEAAAEFQQTVSLVPSRPEGHFVMALALLDARQDADARREFETALRLAPGYTDALAQLAFLDMATNRPDSAEARVAAQVQKTPRSAPTHNLLGQVYAARGKQAEAEAEFLKAIELDPSLTDPRLRLAAMYEAAGKPDQAIAQSEAAAKTGRETLRAAMLLGIGYQQKGDLTKARQAYEQILALDPSNGAAANNLSLLLSDQGVELPKALQLAQIARQAAPNDPRVADTYGWALYRNDRAEEALNILKDCAAKLPDAPTIQYHLGLTAQKAGDAALARAALTKAVNSTAPFPAREEARQALAQLK